MPYNKDQDRVSGQYYNPHKPSPHAAEGITTKAVDCALVLCTKSPDNTYEYRIGRFKDIGQLEQGLRRREAPTLLNPQVAQNCFGNSPVFNERAVAIVRAEEVYPDHAGIKVFTMPCVFPR